MMKLLEALEKYLLYTAIAVFPVFFLLNSSAPAVFPRAELLFIVGSILIILWLIKIVIKGSISFAFGKFDFGVLLLAIGYLLSTIFRTPNKMEAFLIPGVTTFILIGAIFYFLANQLDKKGKINLSITYFISGIILSLCLIFTQLNLFSKIPQLPLLVKDTNFNPLGGVIPAVLFLLPTLFIGASLILKDKDLTKRIFWTVSEAVLLVAAVILIASALPGKPNYPRFPSLSVSWEVAVQTLAKSPVFGVGPANYLTAFNQFRPVSYNSTDLWAVRFTTANNFYLTLITETGLLGLAALVIILLAVYRSVSSDLKNIEKLGLVAFLIAITFLPVSPTLIFSLFILLALTGSSETNVKSAAFSPRFLSYAFAALVLTGFVIVNYFGAKMVLAEATFKKSLDSLAKNDAKTTYDLMQKAVNQNPRVDRYHASLAQVDMALAQSIASKKDLTDNDKTAVTQLVQSAINEGKATVVLNPGRSGNWEILAQIYRSVMPFATGADQFAIQTYTQAIALDPTNPNLRIALGGVYYALGRYDDAIDAFKLAALAKPDLANAHYNLAIAYREKKNYDAAITEINAVLGLVQKDSADYKLAQSTLDDLKNQRPSSAKAGSAAGASEGQGNLTAPQRNPSPKISPPIELPKEATPPAGN